jgi:DNA-binding MarR family transcriptional regulator
LVDVVNQRTRELSNDLVVLSARLVREVRRHNSAIPAASTRLLSLLDELGPSTVSVLAQADRCSQPTMTGLVNGLAAKGWVERVPHPADARSSLVRVTDDGHRTLTELRGRNAALVAERLARAGHTESELATAVAVLTDALSTAGPDTEGRP